MTGAAEPVNDPHGRAIKNPNSYLSSDGKELFRDRVFARRMKGVLDIVVWRARLDEIDQTFHRNLMHAIARGSLLPTAGAAQICGNFLRLTEIAKSGMTADERAETDIVQVELLQRLLRNQILDAYVAAGVAPVKTGKPDEPSLGG